MASSDGLPIIVSDVRVSDTEANAENGQANFVKNNENVNVNAKTKLIGLTKEQLEQYRNDPFWKPIRYGLFIAFWLVWLGMFLGAILLVLLSPKCSEIKQKWYENTINYQIYTPTFYDSDGDGVGDLRGISEKLDELRRIGVRSIRPTPIFTTIKDEFAHAKIVDLLNVDQRFGTATDMRALVEAAHAKNMRVIADLPLTAKYPKIKEIVLLDVDDPIIQNKLVVAAQDLLRFGVDGIQITDYGYAQKSANKVKSLNPLIAKIREKADAIEKSELLIVVESAWRHSASLADLYVRPLTNDDASAGGVALLTQLAESVQEASRMFPINEQAMPRPMWSYADLDTPRLDQQIDLDPILVSHTNETVALFSLIQLFLPGSISVYYGEEYGLKSIRPLSAAQFPQRGLMRWDANLKNVGFSNVSGGNFFGDIGTGFKSIAYKSQYDDVRSQLSAFKRVAQLRNSNPILQCGLLKFKNDDGLQVYVRRAVDNDTTTSGEIFVLVVNWYADGGKTLSRQIDAKILRDLVGDHSLARVNVRVVAPDTAADRLFNGRIVDLENVALELAPYEAVLLQIS